MINDYDEDFLKTLNECYPFNRYILSDPKSLGTLFDDVKLVELFVPNVDKREEFEFWDKDDIYVKLKFGDNVVVRMAYFDFEEHIRENIRDIIMDDFGEYAWECMYVDHDDLSDLKDVLLRQEKLIALSGCDYSECEVKEGFCMKDTIALLDGLPIRNLHNDDIVIDEKTGEELIVRREYPVWYNAQIGRVEDDDKRCEYIVLYHKSNEIKKGFNYAAVFEKGTVKLRGYKRK